MLPVNDGVSMEVVERQSHLGSVHDCHVLIKVTIDINQALHITTDQILHHLQRRKQQLLYHYIVYDIFRTAKISN